MNALIRSFNQQSPVQQIWGNHLLRIALGVMFIAHSVALKYFAFTLPGTAQYFASLGLPSALAYVVFAAEAIGGVSFPEL